MNDKKQNPEEENKEKEGGDITKLDASPAPDAVSKVAKGEEPDNDDVPSADWINKLSGSKPLHPNSPSVTDIDNAYAMLFQGLAGIMAHKADQ